VRIPHLGLIGKVIEVRGDRLVALADGLRLTLGREAVRPLDAEKQGSSADPEVPDQGRADWGWHAEVEGAQPEIDLRGETGEEGWARLDKLIDRAIPAGLEEINVIHGFGTGRLREHLHARLKADSRVASFTEAGPGQGGGGATRVFLAG
jgi:DNA mismatch repair protein MutS2